MSGGMKYTDVGIDPSVGVYDLGLGCIVLGSILAQRATEAAVEAVRRLEAEEATLATGLKASKSGCTPVAESVRTLLAQQKGNILPADHAGLCKRITAADTVMESARTHIALQEALLEFGRLEKDIARACRKKEADDARNGKSPGMSLLRARYAELKREAGSLLDNPGIGPMGPAGAAAVKSALASAGGALQTTNESMIEAHLSRLELAVHTLEESAREHGEACERRNALYRQADSEFVAIICGLQADPVVMRWHAASVDSLEQGLLSMRSADQSVKEAPMERVASARETAATIVKEANGAQIKADQRDYIARSISSTLEDMGFVVGEPVEEYPGHPATASIVHAATISGKAIAISVPVEGQVWYNVEGYAKTVEASVGGGEAAVCDEAEAVIEQMHEALAEEFHVQMGELQWDGKDPKRKLRAVKSLPRTESSSRQQS